ncbi:MAG: endonuclease domain-containing protein [Clostridia bacterium]|nr:endonuclease domain-containing protein [Clostridia bacterium]
MKHNPKLTPYARDLRNNMTPQERKLWYEYLRKYPIQFRRQVTVEHYILDFYCAQAKLAVEIDGAQHYEAQGKQHDLCRTNYLNSVGIEVLRFTNSDVEEKFLGVCLMIDNRVKNRISQMI